jgi:hypothetical protein
LRLCSTSGAMAATAARRARRVFQSPDINGHIVVRSSAAREAAVVNGANSKLLFSNQFC